MPSPVVATHCNARLFGNDRFLSLLNLNQFSLVDTAW